MTIAWDSILSAAIAIAGYAAGMAIALTVNKGLKRYDKSA